MRFEQLLISILDISGGLQTKSVISTYPNAI